MMSGTMVAALALGWSILTSVVVVWNHFTTLQILLKIAELRLAAEQWRTQDRHDMREEVHKIVFAAVTNLDEKIERLTDDNNREHDKLWGHFRAN
jgi:hypothetical protein